MKVRPEKPDPMHATRSFLGLLNPTFGLSIDAIKLLGESESEVLIARYVELKCQSICGQLLVDTLYAIDGFDLLKSDASPQKRHTFY